MTNDYKKLANEGMSAEQLANTFSKDYFNGKVITYPINPFQMMTDLGITFLIRPFQKCEGIYIPAEDENDIPFVGINIKRPISRQRFSATHELCHHLKDCDNQFAYLENQQSDVEKYAETVTSELLMPTVDFRKQAAIYEKWIY